MSIAATSSGAPQPSAPVSAPLSWARQIHQGFFPLALEMARPADVSDIQTVAKVRQGCRLARIQAPAHVARMTEPACLSLPRRQVKVLWLRQGSAQFRQGRQSVDLRAGEWLLYEASRPYELAMSEGVDFSVMFHAVDEGDVWLQACQRRPQSPHSTTEASKLALDMVSAALAEDVHLGSATCSAFSLSVRALLDIAMQFQGRQAAELRGQDAWMSLLNQAKVYLLAHLTEPGLTSDRLAAELGVSRRSLYKAFEQVQERPQAFLLQARLQRCRELLQSDLGGHRNLADLALSHGFSDAAHFSRTYKKVFGESPSQSRQRSPA